MLSVCRTSLKEFMLTHNIGSPTQDSFYSVIAAPIIDSVLKIHAINMNTSTNISRYELVLEQKPFPEVDYEVLVNVFYEELKSRNIDTIPVVLEENHIFMSSTLLNYTICFKLI